MVGEAKVGLVALTERCVWFALKIAQDMWVGISDHAAITAVLMHVIAVA
jgi:hypothetical protein